MMHEHIVTGLATALRAGTLTSDVVAIEARKGAEADDAPAIPASIARPEPTRLPRLRAADATSLAAWRFSRLPPESRPLPSAARL
ncbi:hypothetical protein [Streptomyces sp. NBC_01304]|uniref:hypothetical protein n=1 Tax=Streptomyces sp. NBC_01304 TaxID=2903818 RepID=UPI002E0FC08E|nr:hypothetical protein OG430_00980 [Streptomyces sp. NBC_01304]